MIENKTNHKNWKLVKISFILISINIYTLSTNEVDFFERFYSIQLKIIRF